MTSPISDKNFRNRAFSLAELLVVIGILAMLIAILLPATQKAIGAAKRSQIQSELNIIALALDSYYNTFHDYPRLIDAPELSAANAAAGRRYGSECLLRTLIAPYPKNPTNNLTLNATGYTPQDQNDFFDGADGPGFRVRRIQNVPTVISATADTVQGEVKGPYIPPEKIKFSDYNSTPATAPQLLDRNGNAILYYPAKLIKPNINAANNYVNYGTDALYDSRYGDNKLYPAPLTSPTSQDTRKSLRLILGDLNDNGHIDAGEESLTTGAFILISAGVDGRYGINFNASDSVDTLRTKVRKMDDVIYTK